MKIGKYLLFILTLLSSCVSNFHGYSLGINYEGNKIIKHIKKSSQCLGFLNLQVAMDAPFLGVVADEATRKKGRTETQIANYDENKLITNFKNIFSEIITIVENYNSDIIIQIARGRSGSDFWENVIKKSINNYEKISKKIKVVFGYERDKYFNYSQQTTNFIFINIGMFARLTANISVGEICVPDLSLDIIYNNKSLLIVDSYITDHSHNILRSIHSKITKIRLAGIAEDMPFITPSSYREEDILYLFRNIKKFNTY